MLLFSAYVPYDPDILLDAANKIKATAGVAVNIGLILFALVIVVPIIIKIIHIFTRKFK